ncbi:MAG: hypothetical protein DRI23_11275 [Candidatus Cloacimonadota bacterium]|nr:MAG: hypothetical protein DRI23_11275 [Candidatus Cloacimonadota bacterium]
MELIKTYPFEFDDEKYEVRIYHNDKLINVAVFKENHPATGIRHQIQIPEGMEIEKILNSDSMNHFIELSKKEISDNLWYNLAS